MKHFIAITLLLSLFPFTSGAEELSQVRTISVKGQAEQEFAPDIAKFSVNVMGRSVDREQAKASHDKMLNALTELVKKYKIDDKDLSTGFSSLNPNYDWTNNKRKLIDYTAQTQVNITLRDLKQVGVLQDSLVSSGFDNFQGPDYTLDKMFTYNDKVLANAVDNARQKAESIALKINEKIDKPMDIQEENIASRQPRQVFHAKAMAMSDMVESAPAQPAGVITIRSGVVATFSLK